MLVGIAAEEVILGNRSIGGGGTRGSDLYLATLVALRLEASYGLGEGLAFLSGDGDSELLRLLHTSQAIREKVEIVLAEQMTRARSLVEKHSGAVARAAEELLKGKRIIGADAERLFAPTQASPPGLPGYSAMYGVPGNPRARAVAVAYAGESPTPYPLAGSGRKPFLKSILLPAIGITAEV